MAMTDEQLRQKLIEAGVKNLKTFGYPSANSENILTDYVYRSFFKPMLEEDSNRVTKQLIKVCDGLLADIEKAENDQTKKAKKK